MRTRLLSLVVSLCVSAAMAAPASAAVGDFSFWNCVSEGEACSEGEHLDSTTAAATSPDGRHVYLAAHMGWGRGVVQVLDRSPTSGRLAPRLNSPADCYQQPANPQYVSPAPSAPECTPVRGMRNPTDVAISPDGENVYVSAYENSVAVFDRDPQTGRLTQMAGSKGCIGRGEQECAGGRGLFEPIGLTISPDGHYLYVTARSMEGKIGRYEPGSIVTLEIGNDGSLEQLPGEAGCISATGSGEEGCAVSGLRPGARLSISPDGRHAYSTILPSGVLLFDRDPTTGVLTPKEGLGGCITPSGSPTVGGEPTCLAEPRLPDTAEVRSMTDDVLVSGDGGSVYAVGGESEDPTIVAFARDERTGLLSSRSCVNDAGDQGCLEGSFYGGVYNAAISPDGRALVTSGSGPSFFDVDAEGDLEQRAGPRGCASPTGAADDGAECQAVPASFSGQGIEFVSDRFLNGVGSAGMSVFLRDDGSPPPEDEEPPAAGPPVPPAGSQPTDPGPPALAPADPARARVTASWAVDGAVTTAHRLSVDDLGAGATVEVRCRALICPFGARAATSPLGGPVDALELAGPNLVLRAGQMIEIRITAPGRIGKAVRYRARRDREPRVRVRPLLST